jgi:hypothetical protein
MQSAGDDVCGPDIVVSRHDEVRQHGVDLSIGIFDAAPVEPGEMPLDPIWPELAENIELSPPGGGRATICQIDDHALFDAIDRSMWFVHEALQTVREPVVAPGLAAIAVHTLLNDNPMPVIGDDEAVKIEVEAVLDSRAVDLGHEPACLGERGTIEPYPITDRDKFVRGLAGLISAPAADMNTELSG